MDIMMIRPVGELFQQVGLSQQFFGFGGALSGIIVIVYAALHIQIDWTFPKIAFLVMSVICCMLIQFAIIMIVSIPMFWVLEIQAMILPVAWLVDFARYPLPIYHPLLQGLLTFVLPYAFGSYYPVSYLLHPDLYRWALYAVPGVTLLLMVLAYRFWQFGLKHYKSVT
jgi:ABC-2 type transport system permease protein